jgi:hypothetical protein
VEGEPAERGVYEDEDDEEGDAVVVVSEEAADSTVASIFKFSLTLSLLFVDLSIGGFLLSTL